MRGCGSGGSAGRPLITGLADTEPQNAPDDWPAPCMVARCQRCVCVGDSTNNNKKKKKKIKKPAACLHWATNYIK